MEVSRRQFFRLKPAEAVALGIKEGQKDAPAPVFLRPPGALPNEDAFRSACTHCGLCGEACEFDAIEFLGPESGKDEATPVLNLDAHPCRWCADMPCIAACADGALLMDEPVPPVAVAQLDLASCLMIQGTLCDECVAVCPSSIRAIRMVAGIPQLDEDRCVGCGLCAFHCAAEPVALTIVPREEKVGNE